MFLRSQTPTYLLQKKKFTRLDCAHINKNFEENPAFQIILEWERWRGFSVVQLSSGYTYTYFYVSPKDDNMKIHQVVGILICHKWTTRATHILTLRVFLLPYFNLKCRLCFFSTSFCGGVNGRKWPMDVRHAWFRALKNFLLHTFHFRCQTGTSRIRWILVSRNVSSNHVSSHIYWATSRCY